MTARENAEETAPAAPEGLTAEAGALVRLGGALATGDDAPLEEALRRALDDASPGHVEEALLQSYLFLGYPRALNALARWRELSGIPASEPAEDDWQGWVERGEEVCEQVYGGQYRKLRDNVRRLHPDLERWMVAEGYGKVLGRPGLSLPLRELCIIGILAVLGAPRQLYSHLRGALNVGATPRAIHEALESVEPYMDDAAADQAAGVWRRVLERHADPGSGSDLQRTMDLNPGESGAPSDASEPESG